MSDMKRLARTVRVRTTNTRELGGFIQEPESTLRLSLSDVAGNGLQREQGVAAVTTQPRNIRELSLCVSRDSP